MNPVQKTDLVRRVLRNFSALVMVRGVGLIAPLIALPYILRIIGLENYGYIAFSMIIGTFAGSIIQYGFPISGVKAIAECKGEVGRISLTFWNNFYAALLIALGVSLTYLLLILSLPSLRAMLYLHLGAILMTSGTAIFPHWLFLGIEKSFYAAFSTLLVRLAYLGLIVAFVRDPGDFMLVNFFGALSAWLNVLIAIWLIVFRFKIYPIAINVERVLGTVREGFPAFLLQWSPNLYNSASAIILGFTVPTAILGGFNAANTIVTTVSALGQLLSSAFLPILASSFDRHRASAIALIVTGLLISICTYFVAPLASNILTNAGQDIIQDNIRYLVFSVPFLFTYFAFGHNYIALTEKRVIAGKITVAISVSCLGLALLLIPLSGVIGFAAIMVIARGSMALMGFLLFKQHRRETYSPRMTGL